MRKTFDERDLEIVPVERAWTIPSAWYTDPEMLAADRDAVLGRSWQYAGPEAWVEPHGSVRPVDIAGEPVILVRGDRLRAFYNVCKHRGGPLATEPDCRKTLSCKYHGWTYRLDGSLRGVPKFDRAELFDPDAFGLTELPVMTWGGLVFVRLQAGGWELDEVLAPIAKEIRPISLDAMRFRERVVYDLDCDWKVYVDNYLEGYHIPHVHPDLCDLLTFSEYHTRIDTWGSLQSSPIQASGPIYGAGTAWYYHLWPNTMLNILPGRMQVNTVVPVSHRRTRVVFDYFSVDGGPSLDADMAFSDHVQHEDRMICEHVQRGLESRGYERGRYSVEMEQAVWRFHALLRQAYAALP